MSALMGCRYVTTYAEWPPCLIKAYGYPGYYNVYYVLSFKRLLVNFFHNCLQKLTHKNIIVFKISESNSNCLQTLSVLSPFRVINQKF